MARHTPTDDIEREVDKVLRSVQKRVLDEVHLGHRRLFALVMTIAVIAVEIPWLMVLSDLSHHHHASTVGLVAAIIAGLACLASLIALVWQRFRMVFCAIILCGIATVAMLGAYWSVKTLDTSEITVWALVAAIILGFLTMTWVRAAWVPVEDSHPDAMRGSSPHPCGK